MQTLKSIFAPPAAPPEEDEVDAAAARLAKAQEALDRAANAFAVAATEETLAARERALRAQTIAEAEYTRARTARDARIRAAEMARLKELTEGDADPHRFAARMEPRVERLVRLRRELDAEIAQLLEEHETHHTANREAERLRERIGIQNVDPMSGSRVVWAPMSQANVLGLVQRRIRDDLRSRNELDSGADQFLRAGGS